MGLGKPTPWPMETKDKEKTDTLLACWPSLSCSVQATSPWDNAGFNSWLISAIPSTDTPKGMSHHFLVTSNAN